MPISIYLSRTTSCIVSRVGGLDALLEEALPPNERQLLTRRKKTKDKPSCGGMPGPAAKASDSNSTLSSKWRALKRGTWRKPATCSPPLRCPSSTAEFARISGRTMLEFHQRTCPPDAVLPLRFNNCHQQPPADDEANNRTTLLNKLTMRLRPPQSVKRKYALKANAKPLEVLPSCFLHGGMCPQCC